jgi:hypothetical protein
MLSHHLWPVVHPNDASLDWQFGCVAAWDHTRVGLFGLGLKRFVGRLLVSPDYTEKLTTVEFFRGAAKLHQITITPRWIALEWPARNEPLMCFFGNAPMLFVTSAPCAVRFDFWPNG